MGRRPSPPGCRVRRRARRRPAVDHCTTSTPRTSNWPRHRSPRRPRPNWTPVLPHEPGVRLLGVDAYASHAVVSLRRDGLTGLHVIPRSTDGSLGTGADIAFDEPLFTVDSPGGPDYDTEAIRVTYSSLLTPASVYDYRLDTGELILLKRTPVLDDPVHGPYVPERYVQERTWATADDGTEIPISVVRRADVPLDGAAPALLYGYGSYEISMDPMFADLPAVAAGPGHRLRHRPRPRRRRAGPALVRGRQDHHQEEHLHRLRGLRSTPGGRELHLHRAARGPRRQRRRSADGRGGQPGAGAVPGHPRLRPVRRRPDHHPRSRSAAHGDRVGGVGRPAARSGDLRLHEELQPVRERARRRATRPSSRPPASTTPASSTSNPPSGWPPCGRWPATDPIGPSCSRRRCRPDTAGSAAATRAGGKLAFEYAWIVDQITRNHIKRSEA